MASSSSRRKYNWSWKNINQIPRWVIWEGRCVSVPILIFVAHVAAHAWPGMPQLSLERIDTLLLVVLPLAGGLLIVFSIDKNLRLFQGKSLKERFADWRLSFPPLRRRAVVGTVHIAEYGDSATIVGSVPVHASGTLEDRVKQLEDRLSEIDKRTLKEMDELRSAIADAKASRQEEIVNLRAEIQGLEHRVKSTFSDGVSEQTMGFLLATHAALANGGLVRDLGQFLL